MLKQAECIRLHTHMSKFKTEALSSSFQNHASKPRHTPPYPGRASCPRAPAKVKIQAEARRTRIAWMGSSWGMKALGTEIAERTNHHVLKVKRVLKGGQSQPSAPNLDEWQTRLREEQSLDLFHRGKGLQAIDTIRSSCERAIEMGRRFSGVRGQQEGSGWEWSRYRPEHRHAWRRACLRQDDL